MIASNLLRQKKVGSGTQKTGAKRPILNSECGVRSAELQAPTVAASLAGMPLTRRETEVFKLCADCKMGKEIAWILGISIKTVEKHRNNAYHKLKIHSAAEAVHFAIANGLVPLKFKPFGDARAALQLTGVLADSHRQMGKGRV